jgi:hypothetical protein
LRENVINRLFDQHSGYWQNGLHGLDSLTDADYGAALVDYLGVSEKQLATAGRECKATVDTNLPRRCFAGRNPRFPESPTLTGARRTTYFKLMEKYQEFNPFKFIVYAGQIDQATPQINVHTFVSGELRSGSRNVQSERQQPRPQVSPAGGPLAEIKRTVGSHSAKGPPTGEAETLD